MINLIEIVIKTFVIKAFEKLRNTLLLKLMSGEIRVAC
jgi:hypothetical protein